MAKSAKPVLTDPSLLSFDEAKRLIGEAATSDTILVGGQAIEFWAAYYGIEAGLPAVTRDIDFLGSLRDAMLADAGLTLPHKLHKATLDDATPNTGMISVRIPGKPAPTPIDYLCAIEGVSTSEARKMAVEVRIEGVFLKVLHPLLCLESKVTNLWKFPSKRRAEGVEQARMATAIVQAYLGELLDNGSARDVLKAIERVLEFALSRQSHYAALACGIDTLDALPLNTWHARRTNGSRASWASAGRWQRSESRRNAPPTRTRPTGCRPRHREGGAGKSQSQRDGAVRITSAMPPRTAAEASTKRSVSASLRKTIPPQRGDHRHAELDGRRAGRKARQGPPNQAGA